MNDNEYSIKEKCNEHKESLNGFFEYAESEVKNTFQPTASNDLFQFQPNEDSILPESNEFFDRVPTAPFVYMEPPVPFTVTTSEFSILETIPTTDDDVDVFPEPMNEFQNMWEIQCGWCHYTYTEQLTVEEMKSPRQCPQCHRIMTHLVHQAELYPPEVPAPMPMPVTVNGSNNLGFLLTDFHFDVMEELAEEEECVDSDATGLENPTTENTHVLLPLVTSTPASNPRPPQLRQNPEEGLESKISSYKRNSRVIIKPTMFHQDDMRKSNALQKKRRVKRTGNALEKMVTERVCGVQGCERGVRSRGLCKGHGGGRRCRHEDCGLSDQGGGFCIQHGGGKRCKSAGCESSSQSRGLCKKHGGGTRCQVDGCSRSSQGGGLCRTHGGGNRCTIDGCSKTDRRSGLCIVHGADRRCKMDDCTKTGRNEGYCATHFAQTQRREMMHRITHDEHSFSDDDYEQ